MLGAVAYYFLPVAPLPKVDFPTISVSAQEPGVDPQTAASSLAAPLERRFAQIAGVSEITSVSSLGGSSVTIQFDYTPNASQVLTGGTNQTATARYVKIEGPSEDDSSVKRTIVLSEAIASSDMLIPFVEVEQANDVGVMPVTFESNKGTAWTVTDAINPS